MRPRGSFSVVTIAARLILAVWAVRECVCGGHAEEEDRRSGSGRLDSNSYTYEYLHQKEYSYHMCGKMSTRSTRTYIDRYMQCAAVAVEDT